MKELIVRNEPKSPISEAYRSIRTNIQFANVDNKIKTILITSAAPAEGKTTTLINIAATMADVGKRVIVVDCDLRKPRVHRSLDITNSRGVTDILIKGDNYRDYINSDLVGGIDVITAGKVPANPSELLQSDSMKMFIGDLKEDYDYVLIDTPPTVPVTDSAIMSTYIDGVIVVTSSGNIEVDVAKSAVNSLRKVNANILGVVLNKVPLKSGKYSSYNYYYSEGE